MHITYYGQLWVRALAGLLHKIALLGCKQVKRGFTNYQPKKLLKNKYNEVLQTTWHKVSILYLKKKNLKKNHSISKNISKKFGYFLQNLEKLEKMQVKFASKNCKQKLQAEIGSRNCKQKLQVSFEFKTSKTRFYKQPITRFEYSKKKIFKKYQKSYIIKKICPKIPDFFFQNLEKK